jgi:hypothetical protein
MPNKGKYGHLKYNEMIRRLVPRERLLEYNVKEGWEPLCKFLGKGVPKGDFTRLNDGPSFQCTDEQIKAETISAIEGAFLESRGVYWCCDCCMVLLEKQVVI